MIHFGVLTTCALPDADSVYADRALILALKATFNYIWFLDYDLY